jgi:hypothetical protein
MSGSVLAGSRYSLDVTAPIEDGPGAPRDREGEEEAGRQEGD